MSLPGIMWLKGGNATVTPPSISFGSQSGTQNNNSSSFSFSGMSFGTPAANRLIIVGIVCPGVTSFNSCTIGGVSATLVVNDTAKQAVFFSAVVPTGTSGTVAFTFGSNAVACSAATWSLYNLTNNTATNTNSADTGTSISMSTPNNGVAIAMVGDLSSVSSITFTGSLTQNFSVEYAVNNCFSCVLENAFQAGASGTTSGSTITQTSSNANNIVLLSAAWH